MKQYWYVFCQDELLLFKNGDQLEVPYSEEPPVKVEPWTTVVKPEEGYSAISISSPVIENEKQKMYALRASYYVLPEEHYLKAGKCRELLFWDQNNKYCGCCGGPMKFNSPISKKCTMCGKEIWPNVAVATICLIQKEDQILMVRAHNFRGRHFGLVAGFVETGETLEECVAREALEETGIKVKNIKYFESQPWPYPCGLMVGFTAEYESGEIVLQKSELAEGGWFSKATLPEALPQELSIARRLIDYWLYKQK